MKKIIILILINMFCLGFIYSQGFSYDLVSVEKDTGFSNISNPFVIENKGNTVGQVLGMFFDFMIGVSIALSVIVFMAGAFGNIFGEVSVGSIKANKEMMKNAVVGLVITLSSFLVLKTINPDFVNFPLFKNLNTPETNQPAQSSVQLGDVNQ